MGIPSLSFNNNTLPVDWADDPATPEPTTTAGSGASTSATKSPAETSSVTFKASARPIPKDQQIGPLNPSFTTLPPLLNSASPEEKITYAEHVRISGEMKALAKRNAWDVVDKRFKEIRNLKSNNIPTGEEYWLGAQAARYLGDFSSWAERLPRATAPTGPNDSKTAVQEAMTELRAVCGHVDITVPDDDYVLVRLGGSFLSPDQLANLEHVKEQLKTTGTFSGLLVAGDYILKHKDADDSAGFKFTVYSINDTNDPAKIPASNYKDKILVITFTEQKKTRSPAEKKDPIPPSVEAIVGGKASYATITNQYQGDAPKSPLSGGQVGVFGLFSGNIPLTRGGVHLSLKPGAEISLNYLGVGDAGNQKLHLGNVELMPRLGLSFGNEKWQVGASGMFGGAFNALLGKNTVFTGSSREPMTPDTVIQTPIVGGALFLQYKWAYFELSYLRDRLGIEKNKNGAPHNANKFGLQLGITL